MKVKIIEANGLKFYCRLDTSDEKTIHEVIVNDVYEKRGLKIESGENWIDLGGNIGAFTCLALSKGATVKVFEPDINSFNILKANVELNGFDCDMINKAVVANNNGYAFLNIHKNQQYWRNSLIKNWGGGVSKVDTTNFINQIKPGDCVKMDIEGSEMPIIEKWNIEGIKKMVFEWSFDVDDDIDRYRLAIKKMEKYFNVVKADKIKPEHKVWLSSWFPPCKNVYCFNE